MLETLKPIISRYWQVVALVVVLAVLLRMVAEG